MKVSIDSRTIQPGDYFIPVKGPNFDGRRFIEAALKKGGRLLDVDLVAYAKKHRKKQTCAVIAVVGSSGKTTVKDMLYGVLSQRFNVVCTKENQNNEFGVPLTVLQADEFTDILIVEMGMRHAKDLKVLSQIVRPTHVVFTGVGHAHIGLHSSLKSVAKAKAEVYLKALSWEDDARFTFIQCASPFYTLIEKKAKNAGYTLLPYSGQDKIEENINACFSVGRHFGLTDGEISQGIQQFKPSAHRLAVHEKNNIRIIDDSYNSNPEGVQYALHFLKRFSGRKLFVFGDMLELGKREVDYHQQLIPDMLEAGVSILFTYGDLSNQVSTDLFDVEHYQHKEALISRLLMELKSGDTVLVKGSRAMQLNELVEAILHE